MNCFHPLIVLLIVTCLSLKLVDCEAQPTTNSPEKSKTRIKVVEEGHVFVLKCSLKYEESSKIVWLKDEVMIWMKRDQVQAKKKKGRRISISRDRRRLRVKKADVRDAGLYYCRTVGGSETLKGEVTSVKIRKCSKGSKDKRGRGRGRGNRKKDKPTEAGIYFEDNDDAKKVFHETYGWAVTFTCPVGGDPRPKVAWFKDEQPFRRINGQTFEMRKKSLYLENMTPEDEGTYQCVANNTWGNISRTFTLYLKEYYSGPPIIKEPSVNITAREGETLTLDCDSFTDKMFTKYVWHKFFRTKDALVCREQPTKDYCQKEWDFMPVTRATTATRPTIMKVDDIDASLTIYNVTIDDSGLFRCTLQSYSHVSYKMVNLTVISKETASKLSYNHMDVDEKTSLTFSSETSVAWWAAICGLGIVFFVMTVVFNEMLSRKRKKRLNQRVLNSEKMTVLIKRVVVKHPDNDSIAPSVELEFVPEPRRPWKYEVPLDSNWEFPRSSLVLEDKPKKLGEGEFGLVVEARAVGVGIDNNLTTVAVKMLKKEDSDEGMKAFVYEMEVMKKLSHPNLVKLLGCCTQQAPFYIVLDNAVHGDLKTYLNRFRPKNEYENVINIDDYQQEKPSTKSLVSFALQVAKGMEYLASRNYVHRDLAARNVLVYEGDAVDVLNGKKKVLKISDFGLSREMKDSGYYRKTTNEKMPFRWMALESFDRIFSVKSDVWSYGILFWEIMSLGALPYSATDRFDDIRKLLQNGQRLDCPKDCPLRVHEIMIRCWETRPEDRPSFSEIACLIQDMLVRWEH